MSKQNEVKLAIVLLLSTDLTMIFAYEIKIKKWKYKKLVFEVKVVLLIKKNQSEEEEIKARCLRQKQEEYPMMKVFIGCRFVLLRKERENERFFQ